MRFTCRSLFFRMTCASSSPRHSTISRQGGLMQQPHINEEILDRYALGALPEDVVANVEEHLLVCAACQARLRQADEFSTVFRVAALEPDARPMRRWWPRLRLRVAGLAAAAAMAGGILFVASQRDLAPVAPAVVALHALRGPETAPQVPAGKPALLVFDVAREGSQN